MAITKERKHELVAEYSNLLGSTDGFVVTEYRGLKVKQLDEIRAKLRTGSGGSYIVTKNNLFKIALTDSGWPVPEDLLLGPTAVAFGNGNLPAVAKEIIDLQKAFPELFIVKGGVVGTATFGGQEIEAISKLPTLEEVQAQLLGLLVQPATSLVSILNQPPSDLASILNSATSSVVNVLQAYINENSGDAA